MNFYYTFSLSKDFIFEFKPGNMSAIIAQSVIILEISDPYLLFFRSIYILVQADLC